MAQYDGSIRIGTQIDVKGSEKELKSLESSLSKTAEKIASLRSKMDALKEAKAPTPEYKKLQKELDSTIAKYTELDNRINDFKKIGMGTRTDAFRKTQDEAQELYMKIEDKSRCSSLTNRCKLIQSVSQNYSLGLLPKKNALHRYGKMPLSEIRGLLKAWSGENSSCRRLPIWKRQGLRADTKIMTSVYGNWNGLNRK